MACAQCQKVVSNSDRIFCQGYCGKPFHMICAKVDIPLLDQLGLYANNVFWMCNCCAELFKNSSFRNMIDNGTSGCSEPKEIVSLKDDIAKLSQVVEGLAAKVDAKTLAPNKSTAWVNAKRSAMESNTPKRRRGDTGSPISSPTMPTRTCGTKPMSAFDPQTTEAEIASLVRECLDLGSCTEPKVIKLVPKGKELSAMNFVSFKIGISSKLRCSALSRDSWPENVIFREFEDRSKNQLRITRINRILPVEPQPSEGDPVVQMDA
ncbi:uncharacterized protein LOC129767078 [Toxorhynchites rutilus septentrionalis]|uniref:uncharacterized protein LOC129762468 n=2 Tax=Toxorhynchites rutilus septentrionalis TaxID=329112 RepID=UPI0024783BB0|nr:uncharacterized protein LOC129762468 [Toxorhynchites rutilus septentrionalis]XP_055617225.1 uncharacterized protein LOC129762734 [Toxorhynchites rutilus septentrionalis]XP_055621743.1 uncharacterized protein LOC129765440 [Toxorhynchites rutilus septentrionalis]XP_055623671.1 uncharacterized protein LOC129767078 [Toxorhynchites rutilus septentrionalis]